MATDADVTPTDGRDARRDDFAQRGDRHALTDDASVGASVDCTRAQSPAATESTPAPTPRTLYMTRIAVLEAHVTTLEATVARKERDLQHVIDRYEHVLDGRRARRDGPLVDLARESDGPELDADADSRSPNHAESLADEPDADRSLDRDRSLLDRVRALFR